MNRNQILRLTGAVCLACVAGAAAPLAQSGARTAPPTSSAAPAQNAASSHVVLTHALPALDGSHLENTLVEVTYAPGGASAPHSHPCPVVGYVLRGAVRMQVKGEQEAVYKAGESFFEAPNGVHQISANASQTEPATFLAFFTCDRKTALSVPAK